MRYWLLVMLLLCTSPALAATYYVATTGSDSNPGTSGSPWRNPQRCVSNSSNLPVMVAGDTCIVRDGVYTDLTTSYGTGRTVIATASNANSGTSGSPITMKSENLYGAALVVRTDLDQATAGILISNRAWWVLEGFNIYDDGGTTRQTNTASHGIHLESSANNIVIRRNHIHDIARTACSDNVYGQTGTLLQNTTLITVEYNQYNTIGRKLNGEGGCTTVRYQTDHGLYAINGTDTTFRHNLCYDVARGSCLNIKAAPSVTRRLKVYSNTFASGVTQGDSGATQGRIALIDTLDDVQIYNNIFYDCADGRCISWENNPTLSPTSPGAVERYNLSNTTTGDLNRPYLKPTTGITHTNNVLNTNPGFVNVTCEATYGTCSATDFRLAAGSAAIDAGVDVGLPYNGVAPDIGYYESGAAETTPPATPTGLTITRRYNVDVPTASQ